MNSGNKGFFLSNWAIDNKTSVYILTFLLAIVGVKVYQALPKEQFPEVVFPQILVNTIYPGTSPEDMENLVAKKIEKEVKSITGIKKVTSSSVQDFCSVNVEFNTDVSIPVAKQKVKDAVDRIRGELPNDLPDEPSVIDIDLTQMPIMNVHLSGDFDLAQLKKFAEIMQDRFEAIRGITRVDLIGALDREVQVNVDMYKMNAAGVTFDDIQRAIAFENMTVSGGLVNMGKLTRTLAVKGEFANVHQLEKVVVPSNSGSFSNLKDIADVKDTYKEKESYARLGGENVITLNVIKRSGSNLINAADQIRKAADELKSQQFPESLKVTITGDQSKNTRVTLHDLINTIIIGFLLVTFILMFFMGPLNAVFVGLSVPLSMCIAFLCMPVLGFTLNMIVLFSFLLALGIVVDDAIVVIENTHRIFKEKNLPIKEAAKHAAGEVFLPVLSGTATTLAPFIPLAFWQGVIGKFMFFLPITLIVTLVASLIVAYLINPVFAVDFMEKEHQNRTPEKDRKFLIKCAIGAIVAVLLHLMQSHLLANVILVVIGFIILNHYFLGRLIFHFQHKIWPAIQDRYVQFMEWVLSGWKPVLMLVGVIGLFLLSIIGMIVAPPGVVLFPQAQPNFIYTFVRLPVGTHQVYTDSITRLVERRVTDVVGANNPIVESIISNVAIGAGDPREFTATNASPHLGKVTVAFVEYSARGGQNTLDYLNKIRATVKDVPGAEITVEQEQGGPPTGKAINIEVSGDDFRQLTHASVEINRYLDSMQIDGVEELKSDLVMNKPEINILVDRERANRNNINTGQIGLALRTSIFGKEVSKLRDANDEYPIMVRLREDQRNNMDILMNQRIAFMDMTMKGAFRSIPLSSVANLQYSNTIGGINRKNQKRVITISSNVLSGYNPNEVVGKVQQALSTMHLPEGVSASMTGEQEEQAESMSFLLNSLLISIGLIFLILVTQFNSRAKPLIILIEILFSIIGVLLGFVLFRMEMSIIMTGIGIVALAGIVVRNGILLVEFTDILLKEGMEFRKAIIHAGRTRMTPVILTAAATMLGLLPLAVGFNIDFEKLFTTGNPHIFFGGDSVAFWGPLSWTMIFGLGFATFLTLILVPVMYYMIYKLKARIWRKFYDRNATPENVAVD